MSPNEPIDVTRAYLPPLEEYRELLASVWDRGWITNDGPLVRELEHALEDYLSVRHVVSTCNGTMALQIALRAVDPRGRDVVTTAFSYVATASSIAWQGFTPVFADIDVATLTLDPEDLERALTPTTGAVIATHVFGNACDTASLSEIGRRKDLPIIYDAAHAFGARFEGGALAAEGDASVLSFHATKLFHTAEGGAIVTNDDEVARKARYMRNFGHKGYTEFQGLGINGKLSELHAAMGLCMLPRVEDLIESRRKASQRYDALLPWEELRTIHYVENLQRNYSYYPVIFPTEEALVDCLAGLERDDIRARRYFHPALSSLGHWAGRETPGATAVSARIACLPLYAGMDHRATGRVSRLVEQSLR